MKIETVLSAIVFMLLLTPARAEVADSSNSGFTLKTTLTIQASPDIVYGKFIHNIGDWWNAAHTFSGDPHNLTIDDKAMGCFCEKLKTGGSVRHMEVVYLDPGKTIGMIGALGPLQSLAANGSLRIQLTAAEGGTKLQAVYAVGGYLASGLNAWAAPADSVLSDQFARFKNYVEHGDPAAKPEAQKQP